MIRIRYLAFLCDDPDGLAGFYKEQLDLEELGRNNHGDVALTDGYIKFALFALRPDLGEPRMERGLHHLGIEVDDMAELLERYARHRPGWPGVKEPGGLLAGDYRIYDPEATPVSLSADGFGLGAGERRLPRLGHIALNALNTDAMLDFYTGIFGFRELNTSRERRRQGRANRFAGDGFTNLAIHPFHSDVDGHEARFGVNHFGLMVNDLEARVAGCEKAASVAKRPAWRPSAEYRVRDPEANGVDLTQNKGWEVDIDKWETVG